jgi:intracellular sulfur oxidation DsrE/DsrF family protein
MLQGKHRVIAVQIKYLYMIVIAAALLLGGYYLLQPGALQQPDSSPRPGAADEAGGVPDTPADEGDTRVRAVLDISVHTIEGLRVLFDRAEQLAMRPQAQGGDDRIVLVLHGPEVEFFSIKNYDKYKDIVDQAARLDAFDVVDVKICQSMMDMQGIERDDIPAFIEQVPVGPDEVDRLVQEGYVTF